MAFSTIIIGTSMINARNPASKSRAVVLVPNWKKPPAFIIVPLVEMPVNSMNRLWLPVMATISRQSASLMIFP